MFKCLFLAVTLVFIVSCNSQPPANLIPHRCENGKFGYVDEQGKEWIEGKYDYAEEFAEDLAVVQVGRYLAILTVREKLSSRCNIRRLLTSTKAGHW